MSEAFTFSKTPKQSLKNLAYESIKTAIVKGDLPPGQRLLETEIASQMGISRGPVREAIRQLDQEGLTYSHTAGVCTLCHSQIRYPGIPVGHAGQ